MAETAAPVVDQAAVDRLLALGLRNRWWPICPSRFVADKPIGIQRLGERLVLWRESDGRLHVQDDRCPHRGAPLSRAHHLGDRLACAYHGVEVMGDGSVKAVPAYPRCDLVGKRAVRTFPAQEVKGAIFAWFGDVLHPMPAPFAPAEQLASDQYEAFLCYGEWDAPYRFGIDNNMDPMHGRFLHAESHSMSGGDKEAEFAVNQTPTGFMFQKRAQRDVNFDWSEWGDTGILFVRLEIPYPKTGGPGGNFGIIFHATPIDDKSSAVFVFRWRKVSGWQRDVWRFLYKNRLEERHFHVLEQDRTMLEAMRPDADAAEHLYQHDIGLQRVRRHLRREAERQVAALQSAGLPLGLPEKL